MVAFFIIGSAGTWTAKATWGPVRRKYTFVTLGQLPRYRISDILRAYAFLEVQFPSAIFFLVEASYLCTSTKLLVLLTDRVNHSSNPGVQRVWNSGLNSEDWDIPFSCDYSLRYFLVEVYFHHFEMLTLHWGHVFIQPWIFEMSKILFIRTNGLSAFPHCLWTWAADRDRLNWNRQKSSPADHSNQFLLRECSFQCLTVRGHLTFF